MKWTRLRYTLREVDAAGDALIAPSPSYDATREALDVINNWRGAHSFPLNTFTVSLREKAQADDSAATVAQRLKRLYSIDLKLRTLGWLRLSEMQDVGGCRAIMTSVGGVRALVARYKRSTMRHALIDEDDYVAYPKRSGYRGHHLIYRYHSDRSRAYNGRKIEMQFRSRGQHVWATAVEMAGAFTNQALKSSQGDPRWLRFFALMGTDMALRERTPPVPGTPTERKTLVTELRAIAGELDVESKLVTFGMAASRLPRPRPRDRYFLLRLDSRERRVEVTSFSQLELDLALSRQRDAEAQIGGDINRDAVLVSVESISALRRAYPNYFLDTNRFLRVFRRAIA